MIVKSNITSYLDGMANAPIRYKLRNWRRNECLTQADAAAQFGVARRTWNQWEQGIAIPGAGHMVELVAFTSGQVQPNDFYALPLVGGGRKAA